MHTYLKLKQLCRPSPKKSNNSPRGLHSPEMTDLVPHAWCPVPLWCQNISPFSIEFRLETVLILSATGERVPGTGCIPWYQIFLSRTAKPTDENPSLSSTTQMIKSLILVPSFFLFFVFHFSFFSDGGVPRHRLLRSRAG